MLLIFHFVSYDPCAVGRISSSWTAACIGWLRAKTCNELVSNAITLLPYHCPGNILRIKKPHSFKGTVRLQYFFISDVCSELGVTSSWFRPEGWFKELIQRKKRKKGRNNLVGQRVPECPTIGTSRGMNKWNWAIYISNYLASSFSSQALRDSFLAIFSLNCVRHPNVCVFGSCIPQPIC